MRRDFDLPEEDEQYLDNNGFLWETVIENKVNWLIIRNFPIPEGYNVDKSDAAVMIPSQYPEHKLDMVNFYPFVLRKDNVNQPNVGNGPMIEKKLFQQWSRHRDWRMGIDGMENHIEEIHYWLQNEFNKRPKQNEGA